MSFTYNGTFTRPDTSTQWFKDAAPASYNTIVNFVKGSSGFISGDWREDPADPKKFLITQTWNTRADWEACAAQLAKMTEQQARNNYISHTGLTYTIVLG